VRMFLWTAPYAKIFFMHSVSIKSCFESKSKIVLNHLRESIYTILLVYLSIYIFVVVESSRLYEIN